MGKRLRILLLWLGSLSAGCSEPITTIDTCFDVGEPWVIGTNIPPSHFSYGYIPYDPGVCYQFAARVTDSEKRVAIANLEASIRMQMCGMRPGYSGGPLHPLIDNLGKQLVLMVRSGDKSGGGYIGLGGKYGTAHLLSPQDCAACTMSVDEPVTVWFGKDLFSLGTTFTVYMYAPRPITEATEISNYFDAIVTMETPGVDIKKMLFDGKRCAPNTSTNPTDWVEIDADDNIVPIYGKGVT